MSEQLSKKDTADPNPGGDGENFHGTTLGLAAQVVYFFRLFFATLFTEGLPPGGSTPEIRRGTTNFAQDEQVTTNRGHRASIIVPNYCTTSSCDGPFYTITRGIRVGIYDNYSEALMGSAGIPGQSTDAYATEHDARCAFVDAWNRGEVVQMNRSVSPSSARPSSGVVLVLDSDAQNVSSATGNDDSDTDTDRSETSADEDTQNSAWCTQGSSSYLRGSLNTEDSFEL